jgi:NhaP-type Na+/H+ or K+/H+ antiporter
MTQDLLLGLAGIIALGIAAQWLAWRLRIPSILLLLTFGILVGPVANLLHPDDLFGPLLPPLVSLAVAVILFEGGLSLKVRELRAIGGDLLRLTTIGALVTWLVSVTAAHFLLNFDWPLAAMIGAILVVTGPTVIGPLLRHLRLGGRAGAVLKWEGIVIDPLGATLAVLTFAVVQAGGWHGGAADAGRALALTVFIGGGLGLLGALLLVVPLARYWVPDSLHGAVALTLVVCVYSLGRFFQEGAGLLGVTVMGVCLANQRQVAIRHLIEFKEHLTVLLVSGLFIVLAARLRVPDLDALDPVRSLLFVAVLILVARPAAVLLSTLGSSMTWREKAFLCWMAPRGIVAAAVSSVFALMMVNAKVPQAERMPPVVFLVIVVTVAVYGLSAAPLARRLGLASPNPQGVLFVGARPWVREAANALRTAGCPVLVADSNPAAVSAARLLGLPTYYGSILGEHALNEIEFRDFGRLLAVTPNDEVNSLACLRFIEIFGRREVYQLPFGAPTEGRHEAVSLEQRGRLLFGAKMDNAHMIDRFGETPVVKTTRLTKEFDYAAFQTLHGESVLPLFLIRAGGEVALFTADSPPTPQVGDVLISLARPADESTQRAAHEVSG